MTDTGMHIRAGSDASLFSKTYEETMESSDRDSFKKLYRESVGYSDTGCHYVGVLEERSSCNSEKRTRNVANDASVAGEILSDKENSNKSDKETSQKYTINGIAQSSTGAKNGFSEKNDRSHSIPDSEIQELAQVLLQSCIAKESNVIITVNTPRTGEMRLYVRIVDKKIHVRALVEQPEAARSLMDAVPALEEKLRCMELELAQLEIFTTNKRCDNSIYSSQNNRESSKISKETGTEQNREKSSILEVTA